MEFSIVACFLYFIIIAVCGWFIEITLQLIQKHKFADRGFLIGPYCPIYGVGGLLITVFLNGLKEQPAALFCFAIVLCAILEYLTSYLMEKFFHARWWDYSKNKFNINGRICLETIIPFGILGLLLIYIINPFIFNNLAKVQNDILNIIAIVVAVIFVIDNVVSFKIISNFSVVMEKFDNENPKDNTQEISQKIKEFLKNKSLLSRRLVDAFPELTAIIKERSEKIKQKTEEIKEEFLTKANEIREDLNEKANEVKEEWNDKTEKMKGGIYETSKKVKKNIQRVKDKSAKKKNQKR